jgi:hypothetical protein
MKITVAIVDDHPLITQALTNIINSMEEFEVLFNCLPSTPFLPCVWATFSQNSYSKIFNQLIMG